MEKGYGNWAEIQSMDPFVMLSIYYTSLQQNGFEINWETGAWRRRKDG